MLTASNYLSRVPTKAVRLRKIVAVNLRKFRKASKVSQLELCARVGLNHNFVGSVERAEFSISIDNLERLAAALKIDPRELLKPPETYMLNRLGKRKTSPR